MEEGLFPLFGLAVPFRVGTYKSYVGPLTGNSPATPTPLTMAAITIFVSPIASSSLIASTLDSSGEELGVLQLARTEPTTARRPQAFAAIPVCLITIILFALLSNSHNVTR